MDGSGYGAFQLDGKHSKAHRVAWLLARGPIPDGMRVCHRCDVPRCVNLDHLFLGTDADNMADKVRKNRQAKGDTNGARLHRHLMPRGEDNGRAKMTEAVVIECRRLRREGVSIQWLADFAGISKKGMMLALRGETWAHVP